MHILEGEVQRLFHTVLNLESAVKELSNNLRTDLQEDAKKMLVTLLNNMRPPDVPEAAAPEDSRAVLDGHQASRGSADGDKTIENIMVRLDDISSALQSKEDALEDLRGAMTSHEGQIRVLMEASQSQTPAIGDLDGVQAYIDGKFEKLKKELDQNVEEQMAKIQSACDDKINTVKKTCEDSRDQGLVSLTKLVDTKEADLRMEMQALRLDMAAADGPVRTQRQTDPSKPDGDDGDHADLWREIDRIAEAHRVLNVRIDNELAHLSAPPENNDMSLLIEELDARMNVTEQNAETHCFYVEDKLTRLITEEVSSLRQHVDERLNNMEDQFTNMLVEMSNNSFPGMFGDSVDAVQAEVNNNKFLLQGLDDKINSVGELCAAGCSGSATTIGGESPPAAPKLLENVMKDLRRYRNDLDVLHTDVNANADKLRQLEDQVERQSVADERREKALADLQDNMNGVAGAVNVLKDSLAKHHQDMDRMNSTCCHAGRSGSQSPRRDGLVAVPSGQEDDTGRQVEDLKNRLDALGKQVSSELSQWKQNTKGVSDGVSAVDARVDRLEQVCGRLDGVSANIKELKDGLERHVGGLQDCVHRMNATCGDHGADIAALQNALQKLQGQMSAVTKHVLKDVTAKEPGESSLLVMVSRCG